MIRVLAGLAVLAGLGMTVGAEAFLAGLRSVDGPSVLAALVIGLVTTVLSAARWWLVARGIGVPLRLGPAVADTYRALFLNSVLPAGVLGDVHRAVRHGRHDGGAGARAVVLERVAGQVVVVAAGLGLLVAAPGLDLAIGPAVWGAVALVVVVAVVARCSARVRAGLRALASDLRSGVLSRRTWPGVVALSLAGLAGHLALFVVAARAAGAQAPLAELVPLLVAALLAMVLPVNVGGWGPREAVAALAFGAAGFGAALGVTVAVAFGVLGLVACLPGAAVLLWHRAPTRAPTRVPVRAVEPLRAIEPDPPAAWPPGAGSEPAPC